MNLIQAVLASWDRQCNILDSISGLINVSNCHLKPSEDGWSLLEQLAHIHKVRAFHLRELDLESAQNLQEAFKNGWQDPIGDVELIKTMLPESAAAVRLAVQNALEQDLQQCGGYEHPIYFLQHLVWHEGWHVGLMILALRNGGIEPPEEWQEEHIWAQWRNE